MTAPSLADASCHPIEPSHWPEPDVTIGVSEDQRSRTHPARSSGFEYSVRPNANAPVTRGGTAAPSATPKSPAPPSVSATTIARPKSVCAIAGLRACFVGVDNRAIGILATEHLIARGCCRVAHLRGPEIGIAKERMAGYRYALARHGFRPHSYYIVAGGHSDDTGYEGMRKLLGALPLPDGVFCFNDPVAIGAMKAILEAGLTLPDDIAMVGAGNVRYSDVLTVPLTTIDQGTCKIGVLAAELLIARMASKRSLRPQKILIPPKLVERESTRRQL